MSGVRRISPNALNYHQVLTKLLQATEWRNGAVKAKSLQQIDRSASRSRATNAMQNFVGWMCDLAVGSNFRQVQSEDVRYLAVVIYIPVTNEST